MNSKYYDVKITVMKRLEVPDLLEAYAPEGSERKCSKYREGMEYISKGVNKPDGLCSWAWAEMQDKVVFLALGHDYPWIRQKGTELFSCADGLHPVIYKLERIEDK